MKTIADLIRLYLDGDPATLWHGAKAEYPCKPGRRTSEADNMRYALRDLENTVIELPPGDPLATRSGPTASSRHLRDLTPADLRPADYRAVQRHMIAIDLCRNQINDRLARIRRWLRWLVKFEYCDAAVVTRAEVVDPVNQRIAGVRNSEKVVSVPDEIVDRTIACAAWMLAKAITVQRLTGARPGELVDMRLCDIRLGRTKAGDPLWEYFPARHKTEHHGATRVVPIGPKAEAALREVIAARFGQGNLADGEVKLPRIGDGDPRRIWPWDTVGGYYQAVRNAARRARVEPWSPNQLRHGVATEACRRAGEDVAAQLLGHSDPRTTRENYIDPDRAGAQQYALDFG